MVYAANTKVAVTQSKSEIERLVKRYGADAFGSAEMDGTATVFFRLKGGRMVRFVVPMPKEEARARERWRALLLVIKSKLESVATGIVTEEDEFLANTMMSDGKTVAEHIQPEIAENIRVGGPVRLMIGAPGR